MDESEDRTWCYTLAEATEILPNVRGVTRRLQETWLAAGPERRKFEVAQSSDQSPVDVSLAHQAFVAALWDVQPLAAWLRSRGIVLRDLSTGLVDFPSEIDGEEAFLCWRLGEDEIGYWHGTDEGFGSRKPLPPEF